MNRRAEGSADSRRARRLGVVLASAGVALTLGAPLVVGPTETRSADAAVPALSGKIVFQRYQLPAVVDWDIYAMRADGSSQRSLTIGRAFDYRPTWSPDGAKIAFIRDARLGTGIAVMNADGSGLRVVAQTTDVISPPAWSPDGTRIAFGFEGDIVVVNPDGSGLTHLTNTPRAESWPAWSPDGTRIAFVRSGSDGNSEIFVMGADGRDERNLTNNPAPDEAPAWSPGGRRIAFVRNVGRNNEVFVMNADGSGQANLTSNPTNDEAPVWSPDETRIAFATNRGRNPRGNDEIFVMNPDGTAQTNLTHSAANDVEPDWNGQPLLGRPLRRCVVPSVVGRSLRTGVSRIRRANCSVGRIRRLKSQRVGRVISQDPRARTVRRRGYPVALLVGRR
jgi:Tol biopolymer transport system component